MSSEESAIAGATQVPFSRPRAGVARRMTLSVTTKPQVTLQSAAQVARLLDLRERLAQQFSLIVRPIHLVARVTAHALVSKPGLNGWVQDETITLMPVANLGVAIQTEKALVTPVLTEADRLPFAEFARVLEDLVQRARMGKLHPKELGGGTFTVSNLGGNSVGHFTPIVNPPQLAILGLGRTRVAPVWGGSAWEPVTELPLSLTFDHAAVDGQPAAAFLDHLIGLLEEPPPHLWR